MAYRRKAQKSNEDYRKLREDLANNTVGNAYLFYGEESYLREACLRSLRKKLIPTGAEEFNYHRIEGRDLTVQSLSDMTEAMPMMAEHTLIVVFDYDIFGLNEPQRKKLTAFLEDLPPYCCVVFVYDTLTYRPNRTLKGLCATLRKYVQAVEFHAQENCDLVPWIIRHFKALGKGIDRQDAEYLIFLCGNLMTSLAPEIEKIGAYTKGKNVTQKEIDAVADPVLSAEVFKLSDAVIGGKHEKAAKILGELLKMQIDPIQITAALGSQFRRLFTACLALDNGKDRLWLMDLWGYRSDYPVKLLLTSARRTSREWCTCAVTMCQVLDRRLKSERGIDGAGELKLLLVELEARRK